MFIDTHTPTLNADPPDPQNRVLVVSYDALFTLDLQEMLAENGLHSIHYSKLNEAAFVAANDPHCIGAVIDMDIRDRTHDELSEKLYRRGRPMIVISPYSSSMDRNCDPVDVAWLSKPIAVNQLLPLLLPDALQA